MLDLSQLIHHILLPKEETEQNQKFLTFIIELVPQWTFQTVFNRLENVIQLLDIVTDIDF